MNTATLPALRIPSVWRGPGLAMLAYLAAVLWLYRATGLGMVEIWDRSETFTHAFVVPPISLWLIWRQREALAALTPRAQPWMLLPLALLAALWWLADKVVVNAAAHFAFTGLLVAGVPAVLGWAVARQILFPLGFLFFAVPFGEFMTPLLMEMTADFTIGALRLTGIPVFREGQQFVIPSGRWSVVEACSGIRYLMASFMVGTLFAYLNYTSMRRRLLFVVASLLTPVLANWLRAYIIVMLGHLSNNKIATGVDHIVYGWVFFGIVITALFFIGARWAQAEQPFDASRVGPPASVPGQGQTWLAALLCIAAVAWPLLLAKAGPGAASPAPALALPDTLGPGWSADDSRLTTWRPRYEGASPELHRGYRGPQGAVGVHLMYYRDQAPGRKLVSSVNILVHSEDEAWNQVSQTRRTVSVPAGGPDRWLAADLLGEPRGSAMGSKQALKLRRVYWVGGRWTPSDFEAKLWEAWLQLSGQPDDGAALILSADDLPGAPADAVLDAFTNANSDALRRLLIQAGTR
ncbi:exosortase A [Aquabacterium sp. OR-4]|uniref:exosortase A n=1 Tax=Aquabacterium sp. OR-4 TaxID=2978127 RepID=UPI0028C9C985|nr:exosortase A [Aquabacterium sp. OR-4]MDT7837669.1 exosortase A [Aquabacterium sp. OR-4]